MGKTRSKFTLPFSKKDKQANVNNKNSGRIRAILSQISGAFMLPIAVMAIAGLFLGVGATISGNSSGGWKVFGDFIKQLGQPVFDALPLLFAAAFVIAFTNEAGVAVFSAIIGYFVFLGIQVPFITPVVENGKLTEYIVLFGGAGRGGEASLQVVKSSFGILSLQTSIFGGIFVGLVVSILYNKFYTIKLPQVISFFGGKRFVPIITVVAMIPLSFLFMIFWPWVGYGLNAFGNWLNKVPYGFESLIFGIIERSLIPFGLHHAFYAPLWYTGAGGDIGKLLAEYSTAESTKALYDYMVAYQGALPAGSMSITALFEEVQTHAANWQGDSYISVAALGLNANRIAYAVKNEAGVIEVTSLPVFTFFQDVLGIKIGKFVQGKYPFMQFALPAAAAAMIMAAPKENRKIAMGSVIPSAFTSLITGVTEPIEFTFLFLAPYMFFGFHAIMAGLSFMFMNLAGAHIGQTFSGGLLDLVIYGIIPVAKGTNFWWWAVIGAAYAPVYYFVFYYVIKWKNLATPGRGNNTKMFTKADFKNKGVDKASSKDSLTEQEKMIVKGFGGWENITSFNNCASRLRYDVVDKSKVDAEMLKAAGAHGVAFMGSQAQAIFGPVVSQLNASIQKHKGASLSCSADVLEAQKAEMEAQKPVDNVDHHLGRPKMVKSLVNTGTVKELSEINDEVFAKKMMGDGVIISIPKTVKTGKFYAPFDGEMEVVFETGHAFGITSKEGVKLLLHIGIDTVNLKGKGFTPMVKQGDSVKAGDLLVEVDMEYVRANAPKSDAVVVILPDSSRQELVKVNYGKIANLEDTIFEVK